jgi:hypothetical protein
MYALPIISVAILMLHSREGEYDVVRFLTTWLFKEFL